MYRNRTIFNRRPGGSHGFTLIELVMSVAVAMILTAISVPIVSTAVVNYRMTSSVNAITGVINSTRYRAIYNGYQHTIAFSKTNGTYQLASKIPPATTFSNVGTAIPFQSIGAPSMTLNNDVTLQFNPSGIVSATTGSMTNINLTYKGQSRTIQVSPYGSVTVTNP